VLAGGFVALSVGLQVVARRRARALVGSSPPLPGEAGTRVSAAERALVYFFMPTCAACRAMTPRMKALADRGAPVLPVDATTQPELARAFAVMATPTTIELQRGRILKVHIGPLPAGIYDGLDG
jgi:thiol-disulfide isomerase/thioredoxin